MQQYSRIFLKPLSFLLIGYALFSCSSGGKEYSYVETHKEKNLGGEWEEVEKEPEKISAISDSAAYLKAFEHYCTSIKAIRRVDKKTKMDMEVLRFKLLNVKGEDISTRVDFKDKTAAEEEIKKRLGLGDNFGNRFGLSLTERKAFYSDHIKAMDRAVKKADEKYSVGSEKHSKYSDSLIKAYRKEVREEYGVSKEQAKKIAMEGMKYKWRTP